MATSRQQLTRFGTTALPQNAAWLRAAHDDGDAIPLPSWGSCEAQRSHAFSSALELHRPGPSARRESGARGAAAYLQETRRSTWHDAVTAAGAGPDECSSAATFATPALPGPVRATVNLAA